MLESVPVQSSPEAAREVDVRSSATGRKADAPPYERDPGGRATGIKTLTLIVAAILLPLLTPAPATAQDCISEITVIYGGSANIQPQTGYTKINVDLNQGAGGDFIYVCYKKGVGAPVTGLAVTLGGNQPPPDAVYTRIDVDLNRNAGGDFIWLWYTKDPACTTIRNLHVQANTGAPPDGYTRIDVDLNRNAGGAFIYLSYEEL
jgi:hypothetical protein